MTSEAVFELCRGLQEARSYHSGLPPHSGPQTYPLDILTSKCSLPPALGTRWLPKTTHEASCFPCLLVYSAAPAIAQSVPTILTPIDLLSNSSPLRHMPTFLIVPDNRTSRLEACSTISCPKRTVNDCS